MCGCRIHKPLADERPCVRPRGGPAFDAIYSGVCVACSNRITPGCRIRHAAGGGWIHDECGSARISYLTALTLFAPIIYVLAGQPVSVALEALAITIPLAGLALLARQMSDGDIDRYRRAARTIDDLQMEIDTHGWPRWRDSVELRQIETASDPGSPGEFLHLYEVTEGGHSGSRVLVMTDPASRAEEVRVVPPCASSAIGAMEWVFGLDSGQYQPERGT